MVKRWAEIAIKSNLDMINFCAQDIGFFKWLKEQTESDAVKQWCDFFISVNNSEIEDLLNENRDRRAELETYELRQGKLAEL
jgi:hypothetical protein